MNKKLSELAKTKLKDFGLTKDALDKLLQTIEGVGEDTSDEELEKHVNSLVPFAKILQGEITKVHAKRSGEEIDPDDKKNNGDDMPTWFKDYKSTVEAELRELKDQNARLESERQKQERTKSITEKAKSMGIPESVIKRLSIADDADIEKELTEIKQEIVNSTLPTKEEVNFLTTSEKDAELDAEEWVKNL